MKLAVLNPLGNDPDQHFPDGAGEPSERLHAPVNYHAFAACTRGSFFRKDQSIPPDQKEVLLLLRHDLKACRQAMIELRRQGKSVAIAFKEAGAFQVAQLLAKPAKLELLREICQRADGAIATTQDLVPLFQSFGLRSVDFIPTPYPIEDLRWDYSLRDSDGERRGIFLGTREFDTPSRQHLAALTAIRQMAEAMREPVTVFNGDGWRGRRLLDRLQIPGELLRIQEKRLPYPQYLKLMSRHKLVFQLDRSNVPGQVAGDALLCRIPCVGGDGATERLVYPELCGHGRNTEQLLDLTARLLEHEHDAQTVVSRALEHAAATLSFEVGAKRLAGFFSRIAR